MSDNCFPHSCLSIQNSHPCISSPSSLEVAKGDVAPHVSVEVNQDIVEADGGPKELCDIVVRLNLGDVRVELQEQ